MTLNDFFSAIAGISGLLFVVTSMLAMSLSLSVQQLPNPLRTFVSSFWRCWPTLCWCRCWLLPSSR